MTTDALWCPIVMPDQQRNSVRAILELGELIGRQGGVELMHESRIGMTAGAKPDNPGTISPSLFLRPFLDEVMAQGSGRISAVTACAGKAAPKVNVFHHILQVHVRRRTVSRRIQRKKVFRRLNFGIAVAKGTVVLQE
jgi:hypothetical protein